MKYKVELDVYCGPLDLLLHLVRRDELTIEKIPVARVADQFVEYLDNITDIDIEIASDFLVMAARLTEMKSRALLPQITTEDEDLDPDLLADETDLIQRLLEYRVFKDISRKLRRSSELRAFMFGRAIFPEFEEEPKDDSDILEGVSVMDIYSSFQRIAKEVQLEESRTIFYDDIPIERHIERVLEKLTTGGAFAFSHILPPRVRKAYIIGAFIALLELVKQKKISLEQEEDFRDITIGEHVPVEALPGNEDEPVDQPPAPEHPADQSAVAPEPETSPEPVPQVGSESDVGPEDGEEHPAEGTEVDSEGGGISAESLEHAPEPDEGSGPPPEDAADGGEPAPEIHQEPAREGEETTELPPDGGSEPAIPDSRVDDDDPDPTKTPDVGLEGPRDPAY